MLGCAPYNESPTVFPTCNPATLPAGLHTGYFKITIFDPKAGCPNAELTGLRRYGGLILVAIALMLVLLVLMQR